MTYHHLHVENIPILADQRICEIMSHVVQGGQYRRATEGGEGSRTYAEVLITMGGVPYLSPNIYRLLDISSHNT
jgi:hypothetical protein